ncbi:hypothetical protein [Ruegeria halocynthiae]|uniref:hypothetical protein n=1 Tax=Ruegeria halocynthiae TaxID=985054 RepID=UPI00056D3958|nr:hypothetical protein [Ruegeria halocynthiae]
MKMSSKALISIAFFLGFGAISSMVARAENSSDCKAYKDATYCSTYNVTEMSTSQIEGGDFASVSILTMVNVSDKAEYSIRFYVTFKLIQSLANIEEGFALTEDYRQLKRSLTHQMLRYVSLTRDEIRAQVYLAYLDFFIEPTVRLPRSVNYPQIEWKQQSEDSKLHIKCVVESDIPFLPLKEIVETAEFKTCMNG